MAISIANLVAWWAMDEASGNRADSHTGGLTLTDNATVGSAVGNTYPLAADFADENSEFLSRAYSSAIDIPSSSEYSLVLWFRQDESTINMTLFSKGNFVSNNTIELGIRTRAGPVIRCFYGFGSTALTTDTGAAALNAWHMLHIYRRFSGANTIHGVQLNAGTAVEHAPTALSAHHDTTLGMAFGRSLGVASFFYDGRLGNAALWVGRRLSAGEVIELRNGGLGLTYAQAFPLPDPDRIIRPEASIRLARPGALSRMVNPEAAVRTVRRKAA